MLGLWLSPGIAAGSALSLQLELPLFESPYNLPLRGLPSGAQALSLSKSLYEGAHGAAELVEGDEPKVWRRMLSYSLQAGFDVLANWLPGGNSWAHEELHRAVMGRRGIDSYDGVYDLKLFASTISVYRVEDQGLIALKRDHPAELVRLAEAGIEGERELVLSLEKDAFFYGTRGFVAPLAMLVALNSFLYIRSGTDPASDEMFRQYIAAETTVASRDFDGHDFTSWVHDLYRPTEPYEARGPHPSGVGIQRYILVEQLSPEELRTLNRQSWLSLLNLADPWLVLPAPWLKLGSVGGDPLFGTANLRHHLTAFGYELAANLFLRAGEHRLFAALHAYVNQQQVLPGLELELLRHRLGEGLELSGRTMLWLQPRDQLFAEARLMPGALLAARLDARISGPLYGFGQLEGKTEGWVAGNVFLDANLSARLGFSVRL